MYFYSVQITISVGTLTTSSCAPLHINRTRSHTLTPAVTRFYPPPVHRGDSGDGRPGAGRHRAAGLQQVPAGQPAGPDGLADGPADDGSGAGRGDSGRIGRHPDCCWRCSDSGHEARLERGAGWRDWRRWRFWWRIGRGGGKKEWDRSG